MDQVQQNPQAPQNQKSNTPYIVGTIIIIIIIAAIIALASRNSDTTEETVQNTSTEQSLTGDAAMEGTENSGELDIVPASPTPSAEPTPSPTPSTMPKQGEVKTFTVEGKNFSFSPATINVNKGDTVKIIFKNTGGFHDFVIDELNAKTKVISDGQSETIEFVASKSGSFEYYCSVCEHRKMGMKGTLVVK
jgi:plastocyanin